MLSSHRMFDIYCNKCREVPSASLCRIVLPLFDSLGPSPHIPFYAFGVRGNLPIHLLSPIAGPALSSCLTLVSPFWNSQSIRTHLVAAQCCSHSVLTPLSAFKHLVHFQPIKNWSLLPALLSREWKPGPTRLWHETCDINALLRANLYQNFRRERETINSVSCPLSSVIIRKKKYPYCKQLLTHLRNIRGSSEYVGKI